MPAHAQDDRRNAGITKISVPLAVYTNTIAGNGVDMSGVSGPITCTTILGTINALTTGTLTITESATVNGTYTAVPKPPTTGLTFVGTDDDTVLVTEPFEPSLPFVKATWTLAGTISAGLAVTFAGMKKSF